MGQDAKKGYWNPSIWNELAAGSAAGAAQVVVGQPLDTIKTRAQIAPKGMFKGPMDVLVQTVRNEGFLGLYKGMASPLLGIAAVNSLLFTAYSVSRRIVSPFPDLSIPQVGLAGAMAGAVNATLASPVSIKPLTGLLVELFKIRMQGQYGGRGDRRLSKVFRVTWVTQGFRNGVMKGFWVTVVREIPAYGAFYAGFEFAKREYRRRFALRPDEKIPVWALLSSGSFGGISYWLACYPLDVVKSRVQLRDAPVKGLFYITDELAAIVREGGAKALFKGLSPSLLRSIPAAAATFATFELTRDFLRRTTGV